MATYWVKTVGGNDANDGLSFANARATLASILGKMVSDGAVKGSILNVVADGSHAWPTSETNLTTGIGTSFSDFGYLIRGVSGASETPALVTVAPTGAGVHRLFNIQAGAGYIIARNLLFDLSSQSADASTYTIGRYQNGGSTSGPARFEGCGFIVGASGVAASGTKQMFNVITGPPAGTEVLQIEDCYIQNLRNVLHNVGATLVKTIRGNVLYNDVAGSGVVLLSQTLAAGTGGTFETTFNTIYQVIGNNTFTYPLIYNASGTNAGLVNINSNLIYLDSTSGSPNVGLLADGGSGSLPFSGTIGNNVLLGGPNIVIGDLGAAAWYEGSFDGGVDPKATDQVAFSVAAATIFNNPAASYAWDALGNGVTLTVPKDLRPLLYLTTALGGGVPGALPPAQTDLSVVVTTNNTAPAPGDTVVLTVTAANTGTNATSVVYAAAIPAGLSLVSSVPSAGSYAAGVWTIGALADSGSATLTLTCTVDSNQAGNTIVFTSSVTSADPSSDPDSSDNSDSVSLSVMLDPEVDPTVTPFLDVAPIYAPVLKAEVNAYVRTKRNRVTQHEQRKDIERRDWREYTARRVTIAPSATHQIISSIERVDILALESTGNVEVSASSGDTDYYFPAATRLALLDGDFTTLKLRNPSDLASVDVLLVVID